MASSEPQHGTNGTSSLKQPKPVPALPRIVPVIPLKLTKVRHEKSPHGPTRAVSGLATPEQSDASETAPQSEHHGSQPSTPPTAPVTPNSSLAHDHFTQTDTSSVQSPQSIQEDIVSSTEPQLNDFTQSTAIDIMGHSPRIPTMSGGARFGGQKHKYQSPPFAIGSYIGGSGPPSHNGGNATPAGADHYKEMSAATEALNDMSINRKNAAPVPHGFPGLGPAAAPFMPPQNMHPGFGYLPAAPMYMQMPYGFPPDMSPLALGSLGPHQHSYDIGGNGLQMSRHPSQTSSASRAAHGGFNDQNASHVSPTNGAAPFQLDPAALQGLIKGFFRYPEFADFNIVFVGTFAERHGETFPIHGLIASQSPYLAAAMNADRANPYSGGMLPITIDTKFLRAHAIISSIGYLYGRPLPDLSSFGSRGPSVNGFLAALDCAAAGKFLELADVMQYGFHHVFLNLTWGSVEIALSYMQWNNATGPVHMGRFPLAQLLQSHFTSPFVDWIMHNFPTDFKFQANEPEFPEAPRLPVVRQSRPSMSNPALATIQFGQVPIDEPEVDNKGVNSATMLSRLLLSANVDILHMLFQSPALGSRIGWPSVVQCMNDVVKERESRRVKVLKVVNAARTEPNWTVEQIENTRWQEVVRAKEGSPSGHEYVKVPVHPEDLQPTPFRH